MINYCIPSIRTPTFEIIILISEYLHLAKLERGCQTSNSLQQSLWSYSGVTKRLPAYYSCFRISTRLLLSLRSLNGGCQMCISLRRSLRSLNGGCQMCISLRRSLRSLNGGCQMCISLRRSLRSLNGDCQMCISLRRSLRSLNGDCQTCTSLRRSLRSLNGDCQMCTSLRQSLRSLNGDCQMCTSFRQSLRSSNGGYPSIVSAAFERELAFNSLCRVRMGFRECLLRHYLWL